MGEVSIDNFYHQFIMPDHAHFIQSHSEENKRGGMISPMPYHSIDELQKTLADGVFSYAKDAKKAAGRALGTLVEIISFYTLKSWGFESSIAIETSLPEYMNDAITHNVEYSIHPSKKLCEFEMPSKELPFTSNKLLNECDKPKEISGFVVKNNQLLTRELILRNACMVCDTPTGFVNAYLERKSTETYQISLFLLAERPFAILECKRVGVEEGMKKGPQTIEKAKQGAYVAKSVSALQKIRLNNGELGGVIHLPDGTMCHKNYSILLREIIHSDRKDLLQHFVLTVGVVSNHGNWFTSNNHNKEMKVLAQSYDWLLFLTDNGLAQFIDDLLLQPSSKYEPIRNAFLESYSGKKGKNRFTKVQMALEADRALQKYFQSEQNDIRSWFNVIAPNNGTLVNLRSDLTMLSKKNWQRILA